MGGLKKPRPGAENVVPAVVILVDFPSLETGTIKKLRERKRVKKVTSLVLRCVDKKQKQRQNSLPIRNETLSFEFFASLARICHNA